MSKQRNLHKRLIALTRNSEPFIFLSQMLSLRVKYDEGGFHCWHVKSMLPTSELSSDFIKTNMFREEDFDRIKKGEAADFTRGN